MEPQAPSARRIIGRYELHGVIAAGGMATVHFGRLLGPVGFSRTVAIKRLHAQFARDPEFVAMFLDEAHLAARIRHPNVVSTLDVVSAGDELFIVMEYVQGETLSRIQQTLKQTAERAPPAVALAVMSNVLQGLHAAHEATDDAGRLLGLVHRDISPQNILVGDDGSAMVLDFGVAKAVGRAQHTRDDRLKGKIEYMAPEQLLHADRGGEITRAVDIYSAGVVLWEVLTGTRLCEGENEAQLLYQVLRASHRKPSELAPEISPGLDEVVMRAMSANPDARFETAFEMALALESCGRVASAIEVGQWLRQTAAESLARRAECLAEIQQGTGAGVSEEVRDYIAQMKRIARQPSVPSLPMSRGVAAVPAMMMPTPLATWQPARQPSVPSLPLSKGASSPPVPPMMMPTPLATWQPGGRPHPARASVPSVAALPASPAAETARAPAVPRPRPRFALTALMVLLIVTSFFVGARYMREGPSATAAPLPVESRAAPTLTAEVVQPAPLPPATPPEPAHAAPSTLEPPALPPPSASTSARAAPPATPPVVRPPPVRVPPPRPTAPAATRSDGLFDRY